MQVQEQRQPSLQPQCDGEAQVQEKERETADTVNPGDAEDAAEEAAQAQQQLGFRRLYLISTYVIGKERLLLAVAERTGRKMLVTQRKLRLLRWVGLGNGGCLVGGDVCVIRLRVSGSLVVAVIRHTRRCVVGVVYSTGLCKRRETPVMPPYHKCLALSSVSASYGIISPCLPTLSPCLPCLVYGRCRATGLSSEKIAATFTTDPTATPIRVVRWGHLGDTWPYFRPNFTNMEADRTAAAAQEVRHRVQACRYTGAHAVMHMHVQICRCTGRYAHASAESTV